MPNAPSTAGAIDCGSRKSAAINRGSRSSLLAELGCLEAIRTENPLSRMWRTIRRPRKPVPPNTVTTWTTAQAALCGKVVARQSTLSAYTADASLRTPIQPPSTPWHALPLPIRMSRSYFAARPYRPRGWGWQAFPGSAPILTRGDTEHFVNLACLRVVHRLQKQTKLPRLPGFSLGTRGAAESGAARELGSQ